MPNLQRYVFRSKKYRDYKNIQARSDAGFTYGVPDHWQRDGDKLVRIVTLGDRLDSAQLVLNLLADVDHYPQIELTIAVTGNRVNIYMPCATLGSRHIKICNQINNLL